MWLFVWGPIDQVPSGMGWTLKGAHKEQILLFQNMTKFHKNDKDDKNWKDDYFSSFLFKHQKPIHEYQTSSCIFSKCLWYTGTVSIWFDQMPRCGKKIHEEYIEMNIHYTPSCTKTNSEKKSLKNDKAWKDVILSQISFSASNFMGTLNLSVLYMYIGALFQFVHLKLLE